MNFKKTLTTIGLSIAFTTTAMAQGAFEIGYVGDKPSYKRDGKQAFTVTGPKIKDETSSKFTDINGFMLNYYNYSDGILLNRGESKVGFNYSKGDATKKVNGVLISDSRATTLAHIGGYYREYYDFNFDTSLIAQLNYGARTWMRDVDNDDDIIALPYVGLGFGVKQRMGNFLFKPIVNYNVAYGVAKTTPSTGGDQIMGMGMSTGYSIEAPLEYMPSRDFSFTVGYKFESWKLKRGSIMDTLEDKLKAISAGLTGTPAIKILGDPTADFKINTIKAGFKFYF